jgi:hypothetical protein
MDINLLLLLSVELGKSVYAKLLLQILEIEMPSDEYYLC